MNEIFGQIFLDRFVLRRKMLLVFPLLCTFSYVMASVAFLLTRLSTHSNMADTILQHYTRKKSFGSGHDRPLVMHVAALTINPWHLGQKL